MKLTTISPVFRFMSVVAVLAATTGCGETPRYKPVHLVPVRGQVLSAGQPVAGATVRFHPKSPTKDSLTPVAKTGADGRFELTTYENQDGAPPGEYNVTLRLDEPTGKEYEMADRFRGRYSDPKKPAWQIRVEDRPNELEPFTAK